MTHDRDEPHGWQFVIKLRKERRRAALARAAAVADETRRRIERDLHDGVQQHIVSLGLELRMTAAQVPSELAEVRAEVSDAADELMDVLDEVRELSRGSHPTILADGGLEPALRALARHSAIPVELDMRSSRRLDEQVEVAAYFVVSEVLANVVKHAQASTVHVGFEAEHAAVHISIQDDGIGGAAPGRGSGLAGIEDRVNALGRSRSRARAEPVRPWSSRSLVSSEPSSRSTRELRIRPIPEHR